MEFTLTQMKTGALLRKPWISSLLQQESLRQDHPCNECIGISYTNSFSGRSGLYILRILRYSFSVLKLNLKILLHVFLTPERKVASEPDQMKTEQ
ncbi:hypothetical protein NPIL_650261 [Nephila pilipes]|uniref:Uncharacterized protein n=1 Tax=Nephila pilipes TaxID=299642 RepID=A0A8X6UR81_NEPPI|nr:hypothetical protein NPIL_650261 [Nephila pilipes]